MGYMLYFGLYIPMLRCYISIQATGFSTGSCLRLPAINLETCSRHAVIIIKIWPKPQIFRVD